MNILLINHYAGSPELGMEFRPYYFAREWVKMGHDVSIIAADYSHLRSSNPKVWKDFQSENIEGINYYWMKTNEYEGNGIKRFLTMIKFVTKLWLKSKWLVKKFEPDVVICSSTYPLDTYVGQRIKRKSEKKIKLVHEVHDMWPSTLVEIGGMSRKHPFVAIMQIAENSAYRKSNSVVSLPPNAEEYMMEHGLQKGKFKCIPNGVILDEWENPEDIPQHHEKVFQDLKRNQKFIVGYFGGHALSNDLDGLLDVAKQIKDKSVHFVLVGDGILKNTLIERANKEGLDNVTFLPPISKKSVPKLCENFDCIYIGGKASKLYRFGLCLNKMFDTMASGKPGICALGVKSYFTEYHCGYDTEAANPEAICDLIEKIKKLSQEELDSIKEAGQKASIERFNYKKLAQEFIDIL